MTPARRAAALLATLAVLSAAADPKRDALWAAVRAGDVKAVQAAIDAGADVNARNEYGVTALWIAAGKGKPEVVELLVKHKADVNARDDIWYQTPLSAAVGGLQLKTVRFLIKAGAKDTDSAFQAAAAGGNPVMAQAILDLAPVGRETLDAALFTASGGSNAKLKELLAKAGAKPLPPAAEADRAAWATLAGTYDSDGGQTLTVAVKEPGLTFNGRAAKPTGPDTFAPLGPAGTGYRVERTAGAVSRITMTRFLDPDRV